MDRSRIGLRPSCDVTDGLGRLHNPLWEHRFSGLAQTGSARARGRRFRASGCRSRATRRARLGCRGRTGQRDESAAYGNSSDDRRLRSTFSINAGGKWPITRSMSRSWTVINCSHFTAEICSKPECLPSAVARSISSCVGSSVARCVLLVMSAKITSLSRRLLRSHCTTSAGRFSFRSRP